MSRPLRIVVVMVVSIAALAAISWLDREIRGFSFTLFFLAPVVGATLLGGRASGIAIAAVAALAWFAAQTRPLPLEAMTWNFTSRLVLYEGAALVLSSLRLERDRLRASTLHLGEALRVLELQVPPLAERILAVLERRQRTEATDELAELVAPAARAIRFVARDFVERRGSEGALFALDRRSIDLVELLGRVVRQRAEPGQAVVIAPEEHIVVSGDFEQLALGFGSIVSGGLALVGADKLASLHLSRVGDEARVRIRVGEQVRANAPVDGADLSVTLELARQIIEAHGGQLMQRERGAHWIEVEVSLPLGESLGEATAEAAPSIS